MKQEMLLLIDGSSMLTSCYYGNLPKEISLERDPERKKGLYKHILQTSNGVYTNAVFAMLQSVMRIVKEQQPSHIAVVFDVDRNTFRKNIYPDYKANRQEKPAPLVEQFATMESVLRELGIPVFFHQGYEADDIIGTLAKKFEKTIPVAVMTKDHDYLQLISDYTKAWIVQASAEKYEELVSRYGAQEGKPENTYEYSAFTCLHEEGVLPSQIPDKKGLAGDTSDNIPGVKGISSTAEPLLRYYGSVGSLYHEIERVGPDIEDFWKNGLGIRKGAYKRLTAEGAKASAKLSKQLATIATDVPNNARLSALKTNIREEAYNRICQKYEFDILLEQDYDDYDIAM